VLLFVVAIMLGIPITPILRFNNQTKIELSSKNLKCIFGAVMIPFYII